VRIAYALLWHRVVLGAMFETGLTIHLLFIGGSVFRYGSGLECMFVPIALLENAIAWIGLRCVRDD
jgi:hypothetical protein